MLSVIDPIGQYMQDWPFVWEIIIKIVGAFILGAAIGCERSTKRHAAGLRTFIIVVLSSTIAMMLDMYLANQSYGVGFFMIPAGVIIGVAIISSNTTLYTSRSQIKGITTSVALWGSCIIGLTLGSGFYTATIIAFLVTMASLYYLPLFEIILKNKSNHFEVHLELKNASYLQNFVTTIRELGLIIDDIESNPAYLNSGLSVYSISMTITSSELKKYKSHKEIIEALKSIDYIYYIEEMK